MSKSMPSLFTPAMLQQSIFYSTGVKFHIRKIMHSYGMSAKTTIIDTNKQISSSTVNSQLVRTVIDTTVQNFKTFDDNVNAFAELNKDTIQSRITPFTLKN